MKKSILLSLAATFFLFADDYVPLSKITQDKQLEYNFITLDNTVIQASDVETQSTVYEDGYESVENIPVVKPQEVQIINKPKIQEVVKPQVVKEIPNKDKLILNDEVKYTPKKAELITNDMNKTDVQLKKDVFFTAALTYSPITAEISDSSVSLSNKSNVFIPEGQVQINKHKFVAEYFKSENDFAGPTTSVNVDTQWFKSGYRYNIENANVGADINYIKMESDLNTTEDEVFPSVEIDFSHNVDIVEFTYGAGIGTNSNIDYAYDYFLDVGIKPTQFSEASLIAGYKNRTFKDQDAKYEFSGPYIGVKSTF